MTKKPIKPFYYIGGKQYGVDSSGDWYYYITDPNHPKYGGYIRVYDKNVIKNLNNYAINHPRKHINDSKTPGRSSEVENKTYRHILGDLKEKRMDHSYDIPYIDSLEIKTPYGRVSTNALDSLAKYANKTGLSLQEALGLAAQETQLGAIPYYNYGSKKHTFTNRELGNSSYFRNYGTIPANYLVRDYAYMDAFENNKTSKPPLEHAFDMYLRRKYNPKDPNHTSDVRKAGDKMISDPKVQEWMRKSKYVNH